MNEIFLTIKEYVTNNLLLVVLGILTSYQILYLIIGLFSKKKIYPETAIKRKYAIIIAARNEEKVIGKLIDSLNQQTYDKQLINIFVVADNCSDNTAKIALGHGAIVYERFNDEKKRKGWALEYLFEQIKKDYGILSFDGYIFFDADNLVDKNFVYEMNKAFVAKGDIVTGYRNVKNFDTNLVSSAYGIHFYRSILSFHRPRQKLKIGTHIAGTGYVIAAKLIGNGWNFHTLTEDTELTMYFSTKGVKIGFCEDAVFFDEQPTDFITAFRQRLRWTKGRFIVFIKYFPKIIFNSIKRFSFTLYDMFFYLFPWPFYSLIKFLLLPVIIAAFSSTIQTGKFWYDLLIVFLTSLATMYVTNVLYASLVIIRERKSIHTTTIKKILAIFTYPWFSMISIFLAIGVILKPNLKWTRIVHDDDRAIEDIKIKE